MTKQDNKYYNIRNINSYEKTFNFVLSPSGTGKAITMWNKRLKGFLYYGKER